MSEALVSGHPLLSQHVVAYKSSYHLYLPPLFQIPEVVSYERFYSTIGFSQITMKGIYGDL